MSFDSDLRASFTPAEWQLPDEAEVLVGVQRAVGRRRRRRRAVMSSGLVVLAMAVGPLVWVAADRPAGRSDSAVRPDAAPSDVFPVPPPWTRSTAPAPGAKVSTRVVTVPDYRALSPAPSSCVPGGYPKAVELTAMVSGLLAGRARAATPDEVSTTCVVGTAAGFTVTAGGWLFVDISYRKGSFAAHRNTCDPACGPADVIVQTREQALPDRLTPAVRYDVTVLRPDDRTAHVIVEPGRTGVPALRMDELVELAARQSLATHGTPATEAPNHLSAPPR